MVVVEVFKTNVQERAAANKLEALLRQLYPDGRIDFDLDDCDRVLRVEGRNIVPNHIVMLVNEHGFVCDLME